MINCRFSRLSHLECRHRARGSSLVLNLILLSVQFPWTATVRLLVLCNMRLRDTKQPFKKLKTVNFRNNIAKFYDNTCMVLEQKTIIFGYYKSDISDKIELWFVFNKLYLVHNYMNINLNQLVYIHLMAVWPMSSGMLDFYGKEVCIRVFC